MGMSKRDDYSRHSKRVTRGPRWHTVRMSVLERDKFKCVDCGKSRGRLECDHIIPVRLRPDLAYTPENLAMRCTSCHAAKTNVEVGRAPPAYDRTGWRRAVNALMADNPLSSNEVKDA